MINGQYIIDSIKASQGRIFFIQMEDYLETKLRLLSYNRGDTVYISKADFSDYTGWRIVVEGNIEQLTPEIMRLATFPGRISWEELVRDGEDEDEEEEDN